MSENNTKTGIRVTIVTIMMNVFLSLIKVGAGIFSSSSALISDGIHTVSDVFSSVVVIIGLKISGKDSDEKHPYGHERLESIAAILLAVILAATGIGIGYSGVKNIIAIISGEDLLFSSPGIIALVAAVLSIIIKEWMYRYTVSAAKKISSDALRADAWHHRSDAFSSIGSLAGIIGARLGYPICDPVASVIICIFIIKAAYDIFINAVRKVIDEACGDETIERIKYIILSVDGVIRIDKLKTRLFGNKIYADIEICVDGLKTLFEAHKISEEVHDRLEAEFEDMKHCTVHVNPY